MTSVTQFISGARSIQLRGPNRGVRRFLIQPRTISPPKQRLAQRRSPSSWGKAKCTRNCASQRSMKCTVVAKTRLIRTSFFSLLSFGYGDNAGHQAAPAARQRAFPRTRRVICPVPPHASLPRQPNQNNALQDLVALERWHFNCPSIYVWNCARWTNIINPLLQP